MIPQDLDLQTLVGQNLLLSGVDLDCGTIKFELNGRVYLVQEDPDDGYRSYGYVQPLEDGKVVNRFGPVRVDVTNNDGVLEFRDCESGLVVLSVGTDSTEDWYYPVAVLEWNPENLALNRGQH